MSGRFVRSSSYRHVFGTAAKPAQSYLDLRPDVTGKSNHIYASDKFFAVACPGGGGPVLVNRIDNTGRLGANPFKISVHKGKVLDADFNPFVGSLIATASEDCYAKVTAFPAEGLTDNVTEATVTLEGHMKKVVATKFHPTASNVLATASDDALVKLWDIEAQAEMFTYGLNGQPFGISWNSNGSLIAATAKSPKGNELHIVDPRTGADAIVCNPHAGTKQSSAKFVDSLGYVVTVGFSKQSQRQLYIWDPKNMAAPVHKTDIDQSAGVFMTHFDPDNNILYMGGKGDGGIKYFELTKEGTFFLSEYSSNTPQKGLAFVPKKGLEVPKCEIARALRLMRDSVVPIAFCVPRKSAMFQPDLYPDTYAGISTQTAAEYAAGGNSAPSMMSMNPKDRGEEVAAVAFVAKKSPAQLQKELDAALKRIAELEAQLKA